jgi:hypothetical protein
MRERSRLARSLRRHGPMSSESVEPGALILGLSMGALFACGIGGCGARTGLFAPNDTGSPAQTGTDGGNESSSSADGGTLCSLYEGPVDSCDAGPAAGPVQRCPASFSVCASEFGDGKWGCCVANPVDGENNCIYQQVLEAGCM